ncbi:hypothetical protein J6590_098538, partial [Homalodisca vitripennis]
QRRRHSQREDSRVASQVSVSCYRTYSRDRAQESTLSSSGNSGHSPLTFGGIIQKVRSVNANTMPLQLAKLKAFFTSGCDQEDHAARSEVMVLHPPHCLHCLLDGVNGRVAGVGYQEGHCRHPDTAVCIIDLTPVTWLYGVHAWTPCAQLIGYSRRVGYWVAAQFFADDESPPESRDFWRPLIDSLLRELVSKEPHSTALTLNSQ